MRPVSGRIVLPPYFPGARIGLLGGSFNPPHAAHRMASLFAMKRLGLDRVWWLVTPGNPLKDVSALASLDTRMEAARRAAHHPRIDISDIEGQIGTRFTAQTIAYLKRRCPQVRFVWLMGADNLAQFHRWQKWPSIAKALPIAVIDRPESSFPALAAPAAQALQRHRIFETQAKTLPGRRPPAWTFLHGMKSPLSSTQIRQAGATGSKP